MEIFDNDKRHEMTIGSFTTDGSIVGFVYDEDYITANIGDCISVFTRIDFEDYFPETSYLSPDYSWCYINQYLMELIGKFGEDSTIYCGKVIAIL